MHRRGSGGYPPSNHAAAQLGIPDVIPAHKSQAFAAGTHTTLRNRILPNAPKPAVNRRLGRSSRSTTQVLGTAGELAQQSQILRSQVDNFLGNIRAA